MFDVKTEMVLPLACSDFPDGKKRIAVRYPSDEEFITWRRKKKISQKDLGRRKFTIANTKPEQCDLDFVNAIRVDKESGPPIDTAEALRIINRLGSAEVSEHPEREGRIVVLRMKVMGKLMTTHRLRVPSVKQQMDYEAVRSGVVFGQYGYQEIRINLQAANDLYDDIMESVEGYAGSVPVMHKSEAVNVLLQELGAEEEEPSLDDEDDA